MNREQAHKLAVEAAAEAKRRWIYEVEDKRTGMEVAIEAYLKSMTENGWALSPVIIVRGNEKDRPAQS